MKTKRFVLELIFAGVVILLGLSLIYVGFFVDEKPAFMKGDDEVEVGLIYQEIDYGDIRQPTMIVFHGNSDKEIGRLDWTDGKFTFIGEADDSAKIFFKYFLKPYVDDYIEEELRRKK